MITELEALIGLPIWTAYAQVNDTPVKAPEQQPWWKRKRVVVAGVVALVVAAPLLTLDIELFFLNLVGLGIGALLLRLPHTHPTQRKGPSPIRGRPFFFARKRAQSARPQITGT